jgi:hypothetical protein
MLINYDDQVTWLEYRFPCDVEARNQTIEKKFIEYFNHLDTIHLLDAGSGTGSNFRYYFEKLPDRQEWTFLEQDADTLEACRIKLREYADHHSFDFSDENGLITIASPKKSATIQLKQGILDNIKELVDMEHLDVVTANALFDLVSYEQFDEFAARLACYQVCLMATLNYYETSFLPFMEEDARYHRYFHTHMMRPQEFGAAMGPNCSEEMLDLLTAHEMQCEQEASQWHLKRYDTTMQHYILHYFEHAIRDLNLSKKEIVEMEDWISRKKELSHQHELEIIVDHSDIFAYPW